MIKLFKKEMKLVMSPIIYTMTALSALVVIPNYPVWVGLFYCLISTQIIFTMDNRDLEFTIMLPVKRDDVVLARHIDLVYIELLQIVVAVPFAVLADVVISPNGNPVGIDPNMAFFGLNFICYAVYNLIYLPWYFKTAYKAVSKMLVGMVAYIVLVGIFETLINMIPALKNSLDTLNPAMFGIQAAVLAFGIIVYTTSLFVSYKISVKNFRKVNL